VSVFREDRCSITPTIVVNEVDTFLKSFNADNLHHWSEDLFLVAIDTSPYVVNDSWSDPVAIWVSCNLDTSAVEKNLAVLCTIFDKALHLSQMLSIVEGSHIRVVPSRANR